MLPLQMLVQLLSLRPLGSRVVAQFFNDQAMFQALTTFCMMGFKANA